MSAQPVAFKSWRTRVREIMCEVAREYRVTVEEILADGRERKVSNARNEAWLRAQEELQLSYPSIAAVFNRRHHSSIMMGIRAAKKRRASGAQHWRRRLSEILAEVANAHGVSVDEIIGRSRVQHIAKARIDAMRQCRERTGFSYPVLGGFFLRDSTTVMAACHTKTGPNQDLEFRENQPENPNSKSFAAHENQRRLSREQ